MSRPTYHSSSQHRIFQNQTPHQSSFAATQEPDEDAELDQLGEGAGRGAPGADIEGLSLDLRFPGQIVTGGGESDTCQLLRLVTMITLKTLYAYLSWRNKTYVSMSRIGYYLLFGKYLSERFCSEHRAEAELR